MELQLNLVPFKKELSQPITFFYLIYSVFRNAPGQSCCEAVSERAVAPQSSLGPPRDVLRCLVVCFLRHLFLVQLKAEIYRVSIRCQWICVASKARLAFAIDNSVGGTSLNFITFSYRILLKASSLPMREFQAFLKRECSIWCRMNSKRPSTFAHFYLRRSHAGQLESDNMGGMEDDWKKYLSWENILNNRILNELWAKKWLLRMYNSSFTSQAFLMPLLLQVYRAIALIFVNLSTALFPYRRWESQPGTPALTATRPSTSRSSTPLPCSPLAPKTASSRCGTFAKRATEEVGQPAYIYGPCI